MCSHTIVRSIERAPRSNPRTHRRIGVAALTAAFALVLTTAPVGATTGVATAANVAARVPRTPRTPAVHSTPRQGSPLPSSASALVDHGGKIMATVHPYAIWWGSAASFPADAVSGTTAFFNGLDGSRYLRLATEYLRGANPRVTSVTNLVDGSAPPRTVTAATLGAEVAKVTHQVPDPLGMYFIFTANFPSSASFCAWHAAATISSERIAVAYMPNVAAATGCDPGDVVHANAQSAGTRSLVNVTAHELMEAITDADPGTRTTAWIDAAGAEIGDKCAWQFSAAVTLSNGTRWQLQKEWSNASGRCEQG